MSQYLTPLQRSKLTSILARITDRPNRRWDLALSGEEEELCRDLFIAETGQSFITGHALKQLLTQILIEPENAIPPEVEDPTFQTVAQSVREYIGREAGTLSVQAMMYAIYSRKDVQKVCRDNMWLINQQIKIGIAAYIDKHQAEAIAFCLQNGSDF